MSIRIQLDREELRPLVQLAVAEALDRLEAERAKLSGRLRSPNRRHATLLGVKPYVLRDCRRRGELHGAKVGSKIVYTRAMKCCNSASLDPSQQARGISGLRKASRLDEKSGTISDQDAECIGYQSELAFAGLTQTKPRESDAVEWEDIQGLDRHVVTKVRVNQHLFRSIILTGYRFECAVCRLPIPSLLVAAHIVPWSADKSQRMNPRNGICLCSLHDKAFDAGILIIEPDFRILIDKGIAKRHSKNQAVERFLLNYSGHTISLPDRWHPDPGLLRLHLQRPEPSAGFAL